MFTGIIEASGIIQSIETKGSNLSFWFKSSLSHELKPDQSLAHNGVCLTVEEVEGPTHKITAIKETLDKTTMGDWKTGDRVNLERCLQMNGRLDGHIVQGHVDTVAVCTRKTDKNGSIEFTFSIDPEFSALIIEKGSISLNGISLTIFDVTRTEFTVAIIPYTLDNTNMNTLSEGSKVNIEFDMIGKYVNRQKSLS